MLLHFSWYSWRFSCIHKVVTMCTPSNTWFVRPMEMCSQLIIIIIIIIIRFVNNWHLSQFSCFFDSPPLPAVHGGFNRICQEAQLICGSLGVHECVLQTACHLVHWGWEDQCASPSQIFKIGRTVDNISRVPCTKVLSQSTSVLYTIRQNPRYGTRAWQACDISFSNFAKGKVISLLKMELSAPRPIFCVRKGSIVHPFSTETLCRR